MRFNILKSRLKSALAASVLLLASASSFAAPSVVNLTAKSTATLLPDGSSVPMWGLFCNDAGTLASCATLKAPSKAVPAPWTLSTPYGVGQSILDSNGNVQIVTAAGTSGATAPTWSSAPGATTTDNTVTWTEFGTLAQYQAGYSATWAPPVITLPTGQSLTINLTNNLSFQPPTPAVGTAPPANAIPTSLTIVGQLGGGLGSSASYAPSPDHAQQGAVWPTVNTAGGSNPTFTPPPQPPRVQSFATEVAAGATTSLTWNNPRPGTYLIESGTHPSIQGAMGLYGILVVTTAPTATTAGIAYGSGATAVNYNAEVPLLLSEIDPIQNGAVQAAVNSVGFNETATLSLRDDIGSVTPDPNTPNSGGTGYHAGDVVNLLGGNSSAVCPTSGSPACATAQVATVDSTTGAILTINVTNAGSGYTSAPIASVPNPPSTGTGAVLQAYLSLSPNTLAHCSGGAAACYPPAVNYTPLYYLFNGVAFGRTNPSASVFPVTPPGSAASPLIGTVLVRLVNAGLRMHVPSILGSTPPPCNPATTATCPGGFALIAEDGNVAPGVLQGVPRAQNEVFMAAGKTSDVMISVPAGTTALPIYDRELSLSGNAIERDAGMLAYIGANGAGAPAASSTGVAVANPDTYNVLIAPGTPPATRPFSLSDPSKGVIANDFNVYGVTLLTQATSGQVTLNRNGTFTYVPNAGSAATSDSFTYCANGAVTIVGTTATCSSGITATVTLGPGTLESASNIVCSAPSFTANTASYITVKPPGVLASCTDTAGYPLKVVTTSVAPVTAGLTVAPDANGAFTASLNPPCASATCAAQFNFQAQTSQGVQGVITTATVTFQAGSGLVVTVLDGSDKVTPITDYRWIIEEDRSFYIDPTKTTNTGGTTIVPTFGVNFHTS